MRRDRHFLPHYSGMSHNTTILDSDHRSDVWSTRYTNTPGCSLAPIGHHRCNQMAISHENMASTGIRVSEAQHSQIVGGTGTCKTHQLEAGSRLVMPGWKSCLPEQGVPQKVGEDMESMGQVQILDECRHNWGGTTVKQCKTTEGAVIAPSYDV